MVRVAENGTMTGLWLCGAGCIPGYRTFDSESVAFRHVQATETQRASWKCAVKGNAGRKYNLPNHFEQKSDAQIGFSVRTFGKVKAGDGLVSKGVCCHTRELEFELQASHSQRRE